MKKTLFNSLKGCVKELQLESLNLMDAYQTFTNLELKLLLPTKTSSKKVNLESELVYRNWVLP